MTWNLTTATAKMKRADRALRRLTGRAWPYHLTAQGRRACKWRRISMRCLDVGMRHMTARDFDAAAARICGGSR